MIALITGLPALALFAYAFWRISHMATSLENLQSAVDQHGTIITQVTTFMASLAGTIEQLKGKANGVSDADLDNLAAKVRDQSNTLTVGVQNVQLTTGTAADLTNPGQSA